jgi:protein SCO1/2
MNRKRNFILTALLTCAALLAACNRPQPAAQAASSQSVKRYTLTGRVVSVDKANQSITVAGNEIPGFMSAMQMPYPVKDSSLLDKVAPGNLIKGEIVMAADGAYLENIVVAVPNAPKK